VAELKAGVEVLVATPGRLLDHIEAKNCVLNQVEYVVLDEADRMLDIGFLPDLQRILNYLPQQRTTLLFSATFSPEIKRLASSYLQDPVTIEVARPNATASTVEQVFVGVTDDDKRRAIHHVLRERGLKQAFVFVNSKLGCARLARALERDGLNTTALHGDKSQDERLKALEAFKNGSVDLLVCTDVAARGLDIKDVPAVFNVDLPFNAEDYVHRIGRTGRAGASGLAVSLVTPSDVKLLAEIEKLIKIKANVEPLPLEAPTARPVGRYNDGHRHWGRDEDDDTSRPPRTRQPEQGGSGGRGPRFTSPRLPYDPLFDRPYEPSNSPTSPDWEAVNLHQQTAAHARSNNSLNIKAKRRIAALFRPPVPVVDEQHVPPTGPGVVLSPSPTPAAQDWSATV
jgi:superfamily II DNA/RNA helicase